MSAPLRAGASTTTVASASPLMTRFRRGNVPSVGLTSGPAQTTTAPPPARRSRPPAGRDCAAVQDRVAGPDDRDRGPAGADRRRMRGAVDPDRQARDDRWRRPRRGSCAIRAAIARPCVGRPSRPTMATAARPSRAAGSPSTNRTWGGISIAASRSRICVRSSTVTTWRPRAWHPLERAIGRDRGLGDRDGRDRSPSRRPSRETPPIGPLRG